MKKILFIVSLLLISAFVIILMTDVLAIMSKKDKEEKCIITFLKEEQNLSSLWIDTWTDHWNTIFISPKDLSFELHLKYNEWEQKNKCTVY